MKHARRGRHRKRHTGRNIALVLLLVLIIGFGAGVGLAVYAPGLAAQIAQRVLPQQGESGDAASGQDEGGSGSAVASERDADSASTGGSAASEGQGEASGGSAEAGDDSSSAAAAAPSVAEPVTKRIAAYDDVKIYSPIAMKDMTGVLFHQASYDTALVMTTELPEADVEKVSVDHPVRVNNSQVDGEWADADALHLYRTTDATAMDTSLDVGAKAGTTIYAPVTGTVVLVKKYDLYGYVPDVEIHIQPEGHPELDLVMLHQGKVKVEKGDAVVGGVTPISCVRDIAKDLTDIQLGFFTEADDPGNHSHIQMNNADAPNYREESLKGAYQVKE